MGTLKDIYDIFADVATKMEARRLQQRESRSREEAISYATCLEESVAELQAKVEQLNREHAEEVSQLQAKNKELVEENARLKRPSGGPRISFGPDEGVRNLY